MVTDFQDPLAAALSAAMPGSGNLARPAEDEDVSSMVAETFRLARQFSANNWPILALLDTHEPGKAEPL